MSIYYGRNRSTIYNLGQQLGKGGEGAVYEISGKTNLVAKIYSERKLAATAADPNPRQELKEKIETMLDQPVSPYINGVLSVAWPQDILFDQQGKFVGYTMPRVNSKYHLFSACRERERVKLYPKYSWKTAIAIAYNLALAVKNVHHTNAVVGDMNSNNIMIDEKGHVTLIDTDSFNITNNRTGKTYKCSVGVAEMLAPELQGKNLAKATSVFTKQTDNFALAIHIFNLLMNNCHPFGCVGMNSPHSSSSSNPIVSNIVKGYCPYLDGKTQETSPSAPDFKMLPKEIRELFNRAFRYTSITAVQTRTISKRPTADEWQSALRTLFNCNMASCNNMAVKHVYPVEYGKCPWCAINHTTILVNRPAEKTKDMHDNNYKTSPKAPSIQNLLSCTSRKVWPLWIVYIVSGIISGLFLSRYAVDICDVILEYILPMKTARIILAIIGAICGAAAALTGQDLYEISIFPWAWYIMALFIPIMLALLALAIIIVAFAVIVIVEHYIFAIIVAACIWFVAANK